MSFLYGSIYAKYCLYVKHIGTKKRESDSYVRLATNKKPNICTQGVCIKCVPFRSSTFFLFSAHGCLKVSRWHFEHCNAFGVCIWDSSEGNVWEIANYYHVNFSIIILEMIEMKFTIHLYKSKLYYCIQYMVQYQTTTII